MKIENVNKLFHLLSNDNLSFIYQGNFNDEITHRIIDLSEINNIIQDQGKLNNKVSVLLAECFQNIIRHGDIPVVKFISPEKTGIFITRSFGHSYIITSANIIENIEIPNLKRKLEQINNLSKEELKELYLSVLSNSEFSNKGGAGLGLIEMARKSGQKLDFDFVELDNKISYFYLQVNLLAEIDLNNNLLHERVNLSIAKDFHQLMNENNIFIIHKGDFSQHTLVPIFRMIEDNIEKNKEKGSFKKKIVHVLIEILQNVSKHTPEINNSREGIFIMGRHNEKYSIATGNYIRKTEVSKLKKQIDSLNNNTKEELTDVYKKTLLTILETGQYEPLGLINIKRECTDNISYAFHPINNDYDFFSINIYI